MKNLKKLGIMMAVIVAGSFAMVSTVKAASNTVSDNSIQLENKDGSVSIGLDTTELQDVTTLSMKFEITPQISKSDVGIQFSSGVKASIKTYSLQNGTDNSSILTMYLSDADELFENEGQEVAVLTQTATKKTFQIKAVGIDLVVSGSETTEQRESAEDSTNVGNLGDTMEQQPEDNNQSDDTNDSDEDDSISTISISNAKIKDIAEQTYTGSAIEPEVVVQYGYVILQQGSDYTVTYKNNTNVGTATAIIKGKGNYSGTVQKTFVIQQMDINSLTFSKIATQPYTKKAVKPNVVIKNGTTKLKLGTDYTVSYKNNVKAGKATVTIKGKGSYTGTKTMTFWISKKLKSIDNVTVAKVKNYTYTGKLIKPTIKVTDGKKVLKKGTDYTVSYTNNRKVGKAYIYITGKGSYGGTRTITFKITKK